jgi:MFS family permease
MVVAAIRDDHSWSPARPTDTTGNRWDGVEQRQELGDVVAVAAGQRDRQGNAGGVGEDMIAIPWFVLETTNSAARTGITAFFTTLPAVLAAFFGGALVDRLGFKRMSVIADLASGLTVALVPLLYHTIGLAFWQLLALVFLGALLDAPGATARRALLPDLAATAQVGLERANASAQSIERAATMLGAPLAGLLIAVLSASNVLWVDAATFAASASLVAALVPSPGRPTQPSPAGGYLAELLQGLRYLRHDRLARTLILIVMLLNFLDGPLPSVVCPSMPSRSSAAQSTWG